MQWQNMRTSTFIFTGEELEVACFPASPGRAADTRGRHSPGQCEWSRAQHAVPRVCVQSVRAWLPGSVWHSERCPMEKRGVKGDILGAESCAAPGSHLAEHAQGALGRALLKRTARLQVKEAVHIVQRLGEKASALVVQKPNNKKNNIGISTRKKIGCRDTNKVSIPSPIPPTHLT